MDRLSKVLKVLLIVLIGVGIAYLSVNLYGKWENNQEVTFTEFEWGRR